jgi:sarcosine oxidase subunit gamma
VSAPEPRSPFAGHLEPGRHGAPGEAGTTLRELRASLVEIVALRGREGEIAAACRDVLGVEALPSPGAAAGARAALLGLAPGTWLAVAPPEPPGALAARLAAAIGSAALVADQSAGLAGLRLAGTRARAALAKGCRVDLHPREFGPGRVARTPIAQTPAILRRRDDPPSFDLFVPSTLARSFAEFLLASAAEFGCDVLPPEAG